MTDKPHEASGDRFTRAAGAAPTLHQPPTPRKAPPNPPPNETATQGPPPPTREVPPDVQRLIKIIAERKERRSRGLAASLLRVVMEAGQDAHGQMIDGRAWYEALTYQLLQLADYAVRTVPRFAWAHAPLTCALVACWWWWDWSVARVAVLACAVAVSLPLTYIVETGRQKRRAACCEGCGFRQVTGDRWYCTAERDGKGCGCPKTRWWIPGQGDYKIRLRLWRCGLGRFGWRA